MSATIGYDDLRPHVDRLCSHFLRGKNSSDLENISSVATDCIVAGLNEETTAERLGFALDWYKSARVAQKLFEMVDDLKSIKNANRKRQYDDIKAQAMFSNDVKKYKIDEQSAGGKPDQILNSDQIQAMMLNAQKMIQERKKNLSQLAIAPVPQAAVDISSLISGNKQAEMAQKIAALQNQIQSKLLDHGIAPAKPSDKPTPLILDSEGRAVDKEGREIHTTTRMPTLKANIRAIKREHFKEKFQEKIEEDITESTYYDPRVSQKLAGRAKRGFKFHEVGKFQQQAAQIRAKNQLEKLQSEISQIAKRTGISSTAKLAMITPKSTLREDTQLPQMEWWDSVILQHDIYPDDGHEVELVEDVITNLVEHPIQMKPDTGPTVHLPVYLTKKEMKKLRRQNRRETWKETQEKIRLGLEEPPEPKMRISNLMRVLGNEAVQDPTKIEARVREQMAKRLATHEEENKKRSLTTEQRKEKNVNKIKEDTSTLVHVSIYKIKDLTNPSKKFKVETNANQLFLTGCVVIYRNINVVVVEGGPKQQKKFHRLMSTRIKWGEDSVGDTDHPNSCSLIWQGTTHARSFGEMKFKVCANETFAREFFKKHHVEHYWDQVYSSTVLENTEDT